LAKPVEARTMPRLNQSVPKYRKHKASGQAFVEINGRRHYLGPWQTKSSKLEYDRRITEWLSSGRSSAYGVPEHVVSITELVVDYVEHVRSNYGTGPNSELHRVTRVVRPVRELYGRTPATDFGVFQFKAVRQKLIDEGLARSFINASMWRLTRMFRWAAAPRPLFRSRYQFRMGYGNSVLTVFDRLHLPRLCQCVFIGPSFLVCSAAPAIFATPTPISQR
jgi:hypothetical protein